MNTFMFLTWSLTLSTWLYRENLFHYITLPIPHLPRAKLSAHQHSPVSGTAAQSSWWPCSSGWSWCPLYSEHSRTCWLPAVPLPWWPQPRSLDHNTDLVRLCTEKQNWRDHQISSTELRIQVDYCVTGSQGMTLKNTITRTLPCVLILL